MGNIAISKFSNKKVWWQCHQCPDGHLHQWQANVLARSNGSGCPQCSGRALCKHNSLAKIAPKIAVFWDTAKNGCTAEQTLAYSKKLSHWQCPDCGHEWTATAGSKVYWGSGCRNCSRHTGRSLLRHPTFAESQHPLLEEWDHQRNADSGLFPDKITLKSAKKVHWVCNRCPLGQRHAWIATPVNRNSKRGRGCPYCAGQAVCKCNSLQTRYPTIAAEWDSEKNDLTPNDFSAASTTAAWWHNAERGSWQQTIVARTHAVHKQAIRKRYLQENLST